jgi:hypothetical protein
MLPYYSRPDQFRGRQVIHFIDNVGALCGMHKGYSRDLDNSARQVHIKDSVCAAAGTQVWFEYVPSGANIADLPSRDDFELLAELGSVPFDIQWPPVGLSWYDTFVDAWERAAPRRPSRAAKRASAELSAAFAKARGTRAVAASQFDVV